MRKTKKAKRAIRPFEHYTVMIALVISLITTFLLGVLLTETLWNGGLGYFSDAAAEGKMLRMKQNYVNQLRIHGVQAAENLSANTGDRLADRPTPLPQPAPSRPVIGVGDGSLITVIDQWLASGRSHKVMYNTQTGQFEFLP